MGNKIAMRTEAFEKMLKYLVDLEDGYQQIIDDYYPYYTKERIRFTELLKEYMKRLNTLLNNVIIDEDCENNCFPYVIIGSEVEIVDIDSNEIYKYRIVGSTERDIEKNYISFLSPVGMALLLKEKGETVPVNTPNGIYRYRIESIKLK